MDISQEVIFGEFTYELLDIFFLTVLPHLAPAETIKIGNVRGIQFPPYLWSDARTQILHGYNIKLVSIVMDELGFKTEGVFYDKENLWDVISVAVDLERGKLDLYFMSADVAKQFNGIYVVPFSLLTGETRIFTRKDKQFEFTEWSDLKGRTGIVRLIAGGLIGGTVAFDQYARQELNIELVDTLHESIAAVESGKAEYFVSIYRPALLEPRLSNLQHLIAPLPASIHEVPVYWVISDHSPLMEKKHEIEVLLRKYREEGRSQLLMRQEMQRYIGIRGGASER